MTAIVEFDPVGVDSLKGALGADALVLPGLDALRTHLDNNPFEDCVVLGPSVDQQDVFALAEQAWAWSAELSRAQAGSA